MTDIEWLREEGRAKAAKADSYDAAELAYCERMNRIADRIEELEARDKRLGELTDAAWGEGYRIGRAEGDAR